MSKPNIKGGIFIAPRFKDPDKSTNSPIIDDITSKANAKKIIIDILSKNSNGVSYEKLMCDQHGNNKSHRDALQDLCDEGFCYEPQTNFFVCVDKQFKNLIELNKPKSLEQKIIDEVYVMPRSDNYILSMIMSDQKITMPEAHKIMKQTIKESIQLHLSNGMISFNGIKAIPEMDIGV